MRGRPLPRTFELVRISKHAYGEVEDWLNLYYTNYNSIRSCLYTSCTWARVASASIVFDAVRAPPY
jgi:hypothetical protein